MDGLPVARFALSGRRIERDHTQPRAGHGPGGCQRRRVGFIQTRLWVFLRPWVTLGTLGEEALLRRVDGRGLQLDQRRCVSNEILGLSVAENPAALSEYRPRQLHGGRHRPSPPRLLRPANGNYPYALPLASSSDMPHT